MTKEMNEDHPDWGDIVNKLAKEATSEASKRAMEIMGYTVIGHDGKIIKLYPDDTEEIIGTY